MNDLLIYLIPALVVLGGGGWAVVAQSRKKKSADHVEPSTTDLGVPEGATSTGIEEPDEETADAAVAGELVVGDQIPSDTAPGGSVVVEETTPTLERPARVAGRLARLRSRLAASGSPLGAKLLSVLSRDHLSEDDWDELEETLLMADLGAGPAMELIDNLKTAVRVQGIKDAGHVKDLLRTELINLVDPTMDRSLNTEAVGDPTGAKTPAVMVVVGVNGTGKTTTIGKLTRVLVAEEKSVLLGAADTFRAAAADQLQTWGERVGVETVRSDKDGADPASVAFDATRRAVELESDVLLVDTAGRLQNKSGLMDELGKITRVITKVAPISEVLLVLDATTGQNGMNQARVFAEVAGVTGIVLTKLDGTAKGGIVVAVQRELGVPVKLIGLGEGPDDLAPFDPADFVDGILGN